MISERLRSFSLDTAIVAFLLAVELGRATSFLSVDAMLIAATLFVVAVMPFFLTDETTSFLRWGIGRSVLAVAGLAVGALLADSATFAPMSLLIFAALASCSIQFYSLFKLRLAD